MPPLLAFGHIAYGAALNFLLLVAALGCLARLARPSLERTATRTLDRAERLLVLGLLLSSCIVAAVTLGGTLGLAANRAAMVAIATLLAVGLTPASGRSPRGFATSFGAWVRAIGADVRFLASSGLSEWSIRLAWFCVGVPLVVLFCDRAFAPPVAWDALTYHLTFPLHWLQSGHLDTLVQPTGEPSSTYYPLVGEMHFYWGLLSTGTDAWSALAQLPFLAFGALSVACIARIEGGGPGFALLAAALWASLPVALRQAVEPMVDIVQPAFFLAAAFLLLRWRSEGGTWRLVLAGAALGLAAGVKYTGLVWALSLCPLIFAAIARRRPGGRWVYPVLLALGIATVLGGYSYVRNLWAGGNPVLPLHLALAGRTLFPGARAAGEYFGSALHQPALDALAVSPRALLDLGPMVPFCLVGALVSLLGAGRIRSRAASTSYATPMAALLGIALFLLAIPYREPRHVLVPASLAIAVLPGLVPERTSARSVPWLLGLLPGLNLPATLFYWAKDLARVGPGPRHASAVAAVVALSILLWRSSHRTAAPGTAPSPPNRAGPSLWRALLAGSLILVLLSALLAAYESRRFAQWERYWSTRYPRGTREARADFAEAARAWRVVAERTRSIPTLVAYAGTNIPYPLAGYGLRNEVLFVPRNSNWESWHFDWTTRVPDPFGRPSLDSWLSNVRRLAPRYLCIFRELKGNDPQERFPIEAAWADAHRGMFRLAWATRWARIYEVEPGQAD
jgi:hypothetical protein